MQSMLLCHIAPEGMIRLFNAGLLRREFGRKLNFGDA